MGVNLKIWLVESGCDGCRNEIESLVIDSSVVRLLNLQVFRRRSSPDAFFKDLRRTTFPGELWGVHVRNLSCRGFGLFPEKTPGFLISESHQSLHCEICSELHLTCRSVFVLNCLTQRVRMAKDANAQRQAEKEIKFAI